MSSITLKSWRRGQTLVETSAALGVIAIVVAALISMGISAMRSSSFSKNKIMAEKIANESLEAMRARKNATTDFTNDFRDSTCYTISGSSPRYITGEAIDCTHYQTYGSTPYQYKISVLDLTQNGVAGKKITASVTFSDSGGTHETLMETFFTNW